MDNADSKLSSATALTSDLPLPEAAPANDARLGRLLFLALAFIAIVYAFLANLRTVSDADLFWQMATGRWIAQHHRVFSTDVFSYTAQGGPWIYPVGSGLLFYTAYLIGGFALISWVGAAAAAGTVALLLRRGSVVNAGITILAVPVIAFRTVPRAELFTVVLFAAYLSILWQHHQTGHARLWWLPLLMIAWVNLHLGFVAGLVAVAAFAGLDLSEMLFPGARSVEAIQRLRRSWPWFLATAVATLLNPWGWNLYPALARQDRAMALHSGWIAEWGSVPLNFDGLASMFSIRETRGGFHLLLLIAAVTVLVFLFRRRRVAAMVLLGAAVATIFSVRETRSAFHLLLLIAAVSVLVALLQRQPGAALLLVGAAYQGVKHVRMEALAACVIVVVAGSVLASAVQPVGTQIRSRRWRMAMAVAAVALFAALAAVRSYDLVTNRRNHGLSTFGTGLSWWFPQRAAEFIGRNNLPGEIFNTYDVGGYVVWKLGPTYLDYVDGRAIPFGPDIFQHQFDLLQSSPDSDLWQREAERYNINTLLLPVARFENVLGGIRNFCKSNFWQPLYVDEISVVLVRRKPETEDLINRLRVDCFTAKLPAPPLQQSASGAYNQWANAATFLSALGRNYEALAAADKAGLIFPDSDLVPWIRGNVDQAMGLYSDAEREYLAALALQPSESLYWSSLATLYKHEGRIPETIRAQRTAIDLSSRPQAHELVNLAGLYLDVQQPKAALQMFDAALRTAPPDVLAASGAHSFRYEVALGRAAAYRQLGDDKRAAFFEDEAVRGLYPQQ